MSIPLPFWCEIPHVLLQPFPDAATLQRVSSCVTVCQRPGFLAHQVTDVLPGLDRIPTDLLFSLVRPLPCPCQISVSVSLISRVSPSVPSTLTRFHILPSVASPSSWVSALGLMCFAHFLNPSIKTICWSSCHHSVTAH